MFDIDYTSVPETPTEEAPMEENPTEGEGNEGNGAHEGEEPNEEGHSPGTGLNHYNPALHTVEGTGSSVNTLPQQPPHYASVASGVIVSGLVILIIICVSWFASQGRKKKQD